MREGDAGAGIPLSCLLSRCGQPGLKCRHPLRFMCEAVAEAPAVAPCRKDVHRGRYSGGMKSAVIADCILHGHGAVVIAVKNYRRGSVACHLLLVGIKCHCLGCRRGSEQIVARAAVCEAFIHADYGIKQNLEVGSRLGFVVRGNRACQMSACREAHYADPGDAVDVA